MLLGDLEKQEFDGEVEVTIVSGGDKGLEKLVREHKKKLDLRHFHSRERVSACTARNRGIEASTGKFLIFLDDDVRLNRDFLKECKKYAEKYECFCFRVEGAKSNVLERRLIGRISLSLGLIFGGFNLKREEPLQVMHFPGCCFVVFRECVGNTRFDEYWEGYFDDCDFSYSLYEKGCSLHFIPSYCITHLMAPTGGYREFNYRKWLYRYWNHKAYFVKKHGRRLYLATMFLPNFFECVYISATRRKSFLREFVWGWFDGSRKVYRY